MIRSALCVRSMRVSRRRWYFSSCTSAHPLEHAMSAYHEELPHGAGLVMISKAYYSFFVNRHVCDDRFIEMAQLMGMKDADKPEDFITALVNLQENAA